MLYREWAQSVKSRKGRMVSEKAINTLLKIPDPGFVSVYQFDKVAANQISANGHSRGMDQFAVYSSNLTFDIDTGMEGLTAVCSALEVQGLGFVIYESGGKGYHVVLDHDEICGKDVPYSHKLAAQTILGPAVEHIDMTLYQHSRLISLPGRIHPVTRRRKKFCVAVRGKMAIVELVEKPENGYVSLFEDVQVDGTSRALCQALDLTLSPPESGGRHKALVMLTFRLLEAGFSPDASQEILERVNETWPEQKDLKDLQKIIQSIFFRSRTS